MKFMFVLVNEQVRYRAVQAIQNAPEGHVVTIAEPTRTLEQNSLLWSRLNDIAEQVCWHGRYLPAESWKHVFSSSLKKQDVVPGIDGGFVVLGVSTSRMTKRELSDLIELIQAFGSQWNVKWTLD